MPVFGVALKFGKVELVVVELRDLASFSLSYPLLVAIIYAALDLFDVTCGVFWPGIFYGTSLASESAT